ncbi:MAG: DUF6456 domain-containing protein [Pseudomonadota bacterium]
MSFVPANHDSIFVPDWVSDEVRRYLAHTEGGRSIRALAREAGCHASTVMRQVRRFETRRDDLLVDLALCRLGTAAQCALAAAKSDGEVMSPVLNSVEDNIPDEEEIRREAPRVLRRLNEVGACLAIAQEMENAVVVRDMPDGQALRTAVVPRPLAEAMALKDWLEGSGKGRIARYRITAAGRSALKRFMAEDEARRAGFTDETSPFHAQHGEHTARTTGPEGRRKRVRYNAVESPLQTLSRLRDKEGRPFLSPDLVAAGERLREDFELGQMGPRITQNWERFLTGGGRGVFNAGGAEGGSEAARSRVSRALTDLGPGLGDVVLRCCCFLEGMEAAEKRMGWSARSGKIVLRIALHRLKRHYDEAEGNWSPMIG